jgi:hypothetical protein
MVRQRNPLRLTEALHDENAHENADEKPSG